MNLARNIIKSGFVIALLAAVAAPASAVAAELRLETAGSASSAGAGESGATIGSSALITVTASRAGRGTPATDLGSTVGDGESGIVLPEGWSLDTSVVPPGGCLMSATEFYDQGNGTYLIRVVPFLGNPSCTWLSGSYHYVVRFNGVGPSRAGSALGVLTIP